MQYNSLLRSKKLIKNVKACLSAPTTFNQKSLSYMITDEKGLNKKKLLFQNTNIQNYSDWQLWIRVIEEFSGNLF